MMPEAIIFQQKIREVLRLAAFEIHEKIVRRTPIDTGRAKASWNLNENVADPDVAPLLRDKIGPGGIIELAAPGASELTTDQAELAAATQHQKISPRAEVIVISNNLDYIEKLENGASRQAPVGMFSVSLHPDAVQAAFDNAAQRVFGGANV